MSAFIFCLLTKGGKQSKFKTIRMKSYTHVPGINKLNWAGLTTDMPNKQIRIQTKTNTNGSKEPIIVRALT